MGQPKLFTHPQVHTHTTYIYIYVYTHTYMYCAKILTIFKTGYNNKIQ